MPRNLENSAVVIGLEKVSFHSNPKEGQCQRIFNVPAKLLQSCPTLCDPMDCCPPGSSVHGDSPGKNTGVGCHALLQGIFLNQGSNRCLLCPCTAGTFFTTEPPGKPAAAAAAAAKSLQSCLTPCNPIDGHPWDSPGKNTGVGPGKPKNVQITTELH